MKEQPSELTLTTVSISCLGLRFCTKTQENTQHSTAAYCVPFRSGSFFLKFSKFLPVVDGDEELPDEQSSKTDEQNGSHH